MNISFLTIFLLTIANATDYIPYMKESIIESPMIDVEWCGSSVVFS